MMGRMVDRPVGSLNKDPIYLQLNEILRTRIESEEFARGDQFFTERSICSQYGVSRATANKSLSSLVSEGYLEFRKGVGTFVRAKPSENATKQSMTSFTQNASQAGMKPTSRILRFERMKFKQVPESDCAQGLRIDPDADVYRLERLRLADGVPMIHEQRYIVAEYCPDLMAQPVDGSLYALFREVYNLQVSGADERIQAVTIRRREAELLQVESGKAGFLVSTTGYLENGAPLWWEQSLHKPDGFEFRCRVLPDVNQQQLEGRVIFSKGSAT